MMLVRYQGQVAGFVGATRYTLSPELEARDVTDVDRQRVQIACEWALLIRALTGRDAGRLPRDQAR
jgi:hypothetical protein